MNMVFAHAFSATIPSVSSDPNVFNVKNYGDK
ncbi:hypothetical protein SAMN04489723_11772 [Algoriphagus aquimarinus]|uniref:Uncharacterized protein n=1 Tax=Algoriphagus aquimarinus TaxID=237018 RepID=A0A1I1BZ50_9BACT|nr:hypothetical protein SAMN04489723_11772 [Algoriphagus aquimarinus]